MSITPHKSNFIGDMKKSKVPNIKGVGNSKHKIMGYGLVEWSIYDADGKEFTLQTYA